MDSRNTLAELHAEADAIARHILDGTATASDASTVIELSNRLMRLQPAASQPTTPAAPAPQPSPAADAAVQHPVAYVPFCFADCDLGIRGEFRWDEVQEKPFDMADPEHWRCQALYALPPTPAPSPVQHPDAVRMAVEALRRIDYRTPLQDILDGVRAALTALSAPPAQQEAQLTEEQLTQAMRRAFNLGQTYFQQADSEYTSQHRKADDTRAKFDALLSETVAALSAGAVQANQHPHPDTARLDLLEEQRNASRAKGFAWDGFVFDALHSDLTIREQLDAAIDASSKKGADDGKENGNG